VDPTTLGSGTLPPSGGYPCAPRRGRQRVASGWGAGVPPARGSAVGRGGRRRLGARRSAAEHPAELLGVDPVLELGRVQRTGVEAGEPGEEPGDAGLVVGAGAVDGGVVV